MEKPCSNRHICLCPHKECDNHGRCCDCVAHHRDDLGNLPNCFTMKRKE